MISAGTRLGTYEIVSPLGSGGMGEVYRARDTKLGRDVAIKILPDAFADDAERLGRFTREAQTLASLNHPNIATIHGVEGHAIVMELLDGATLRDELSGTPLPPRKAVDWAIQIAHGLAAAHEKGIVHRDLKPENVFVTRDGRVKLLDFGISRVQRPDTAATMTSLGAPATAAGVVLGTVGYMSPEQVRGREVDERSDIFSLGAVLYEMFSGRRPFSGGSPVETMNAILTADPPALDEGVRGVAPVLERIVRRCLEKRPADRFHSAHDVALALEAVSGVSTQTIAAVPSASSRRRWALAAAALAIAVAATGTAVWRMRTATAPALPSFQRLTFERGTINGARFIPNSTDVVYSAAWQGAAPELFTVRSKRPESLPVGHNDASLFAISPTQDLALMLAPHLSTGHWSGTLATAPIGGGGARQVATRVIAADFAPDGSLIYADYDGEHAHIRTASGAVIHETASMVIALRAAPAGGNIAFVTLEPATRPLHILDAAGASRTLVDSGDVSGLAWTPDGAEVLFSEPSVTGQTTISAIRPGGQRRMVWRGAGMFVLEDISSTGAMLARFVDSTSGVLVQQGASAPAADLGWLDDSTAADVSPSGDALLLNARFGSVGGAYYIRKLDGSPAVKLGEGTALAWSPDGREILALSDTRTTVLASVGPGTPHVIAHPDTTSFFGWFLPNGRILLNGQRQTTKWRFFFLDRDGRIRPVGPDGLDHWVGQHVPSDDGTLLAAYPSGHNDVADPIIVPLDGGKPIPTAGFKTDEVVVRFTPDNQRLLVYDRDRLPVRIDALDYRTGARSLWREFMPADPTGIRGVKSIAMSPGGGVVAYNYTRQLSTLYLIEGLR